MQNDGIVRGRFSNRTIAITGAAGDIGGRTAHRFAAEGAGLLLLDQNEAGITTLAEALGTYGVEAVPQACDVTEEDSVIRAVSAGLERLGSIDFLFNNAGYQGEFQQAHRYPAEDFLRVLTVNLYGAFVVLKIVSQHMVQRKQGAIVNTASMAGIKGPPNMIAYGASKFGVVGMTETAAKDLAPYGIRVNAISPGFIGPARMWTRQTQAQAELRTQYYDTDPEVVAKQMLAKVAMRRNGSVDEIPGTVAFLMSDDASYITGANIPISGGI